MKKLKRRIIGKGKNTRIQESASHRLKERRLVLGGDGGER